MNIYLHMNIYKGKRDGWIGVWRRENHINQLAFKAYFFLSLSLSLSRLLSSVFPPLHLYLLVDKSKYRLCRKRLVILVSENTCERGERERDPTLRSFCFDKWSSCSGCKIVPQNPSPANWFLIFHHPFFNQERKGGERKRESRVWGWAFVCFADSLNGHRLGWFKSTG